jgi:cell division protein FtsI/penicillin-binding protein 2
LRCILTSLFVLGVCVPDVYARDAIAGAFAGRQGCAVALDVKSGRVVLAHRLDVCAGVVTRPGSTVKPFTIAALLDRGVLTSQTTFACKRTVRLAGRDMDCSHDHLASSLSPADAIAFSCNSFVTHFASKLTSADLAHAFESYGLATRTGLAPTEATGEITIAPNVEQRELQSIGESNILVTPLALANAYRKLARNAPAVIREGLIRAVSDGTAQMAASQRIAIAGKTGTTLTLDGSRRQAWFAGFAPVNDPQIAFVVFVPQGSGARDAAPIARVLVEVWAAQH